MCAQGPTSSSGAGGRPEAPGLHARWERAGTGGSDRERRGPTREATPALGGARGAGMGPRRPPPIGTFGPRERRWRRARKTTGAQQEKVAAGPEGSRTTTAGLWGTDGRPYLQSFNPYTRFSLSLNLCTRRGRCRGEKGRRLSLPDQRSHKRLSLVRKEEGGGRVAFEGWFTDIPSARLILRKNVLLTKF